MRISRKSFFLRKVGDKMKTFVFCGQGSQIVGMGKDYFDEFTELVKAADNILGYSIKDLCLYDENKQLNLTKYTQPALYVVSVLEYLHKKNLGEIPDYLIGHSIGEYAALYAAGVYSFEDGLRLVKRRGELMFDEKGGGMAAVIGLSGEQVQNIIDNNNLSAIDIANYNSMTQVAISGPADIVESCNEIFTKGGARAVMPLKVSGAFHSRYLRNAQNKLYEYMKDFKFNDPKIPVVANLTARPYENKKVKNTLIQQLSNSVQWVESVRYLLADNMEFIPIGPGNATINLVKSIQSNMSPLSEQEKQTRKIQIDYDIDFEESTKQVEVKETALGCKEFRDTYKTRYNYVVGGMCSGISGVDLVTAACNGKLLSFLGTNGLTMDEVENKILQLKSKVHNDTLYGINITKDYSQPHIFTDLLRLCLKHNVKVVELSNVMAITKDLVLYRVKGMQFNGAQVTGGNRILAKISQSYMAREFMLPAPVDILEELLSENSITKEEYSIALQIPMADDICVVGDVAFETERNNLLTFLPEVLAIKNEVVNSNKLIVNSRIGVAGGIGSPTVVSTLFNMGSDFILTGSINQCTIEADVADLIKEQLAQITTYDVGYAPSERLFELGKEVQVLKKGIFYPARAKKLKNIYDFVDSIDMIPSDIAQYIEERFFNAKLEKVYENITSKGFSEKRLELAAKNSKYKLSLVFKEYLKEAFNKTRKMNMTQDDLVNSVIYCSKAMGLLNEELKKTEYSLWQNRSVVKIAEYLMG